MPDDLTLEEQAALTAGKDFWHTVPIERAGIPSLRMTDGPSGARGERWSVYTSASLPSGSALAATWNRELVRRVGRVLGDEARAKGAGLLLAPTVNLHRHPITGRHFECFSEDPLLTTELALAYIGGVQERGVGAVIKHFVCNDQEHERQTISVDIEERALRELYLPPFEAAVRAGVWGVMGAYNRLGGTYCCEHHWLLVELLREEWGFRGVVVSDWFGTHSTAAVSAGLDLEMPGPARHMGPHLVDAVARGDVASADVANAAGRVLDLVRRGTSPNATTRGEAASEVAREAASEAIVLLRNEANVLPLTSDKRIALIGPNADRLAIQGGGSAEVTPAYVTSPLAGIRERGIDVVYEPGCGVPGPTPLLDYRWLPNNLAVEVFASDDLNGEPALRETVMRSLARWGGTPAPGVDPSRYSARVTGEFIPDRTAPWQFGLASAGAARLLLDGQVLIDNALSREPDPLFRQGRYESTAEVELVAGSRHQLVAELRVSVNVPQAGLRIGARPLPTRDALERAVEAARAADVAVVVVGYDGSWEAEGEDRPHMDLPGDQDQLVRAVAAANPRTIVAVNAGAPVTMDWADQAAAIVQVWFAGMEAGNALADVLFGDVNPSGRLPTTFPVRLSETPAYEWYPGDNGVVRYGEGLLVGYRHYDRRGVEPRFCFGHGLSYSTFVYRNLRVDGDTVSVDITNQGPRPGAEVVQLYVRDLSATPEEPVKELRQFAKVHLAVGETRTVALPLVDRAFSCWDAARHHWRRRGGPFEVLVGASSRDIRLRAKYPT